MSFTFRRPDVTEYDTVYNFYSELIDTSPYTPNWKMGCFPDETLLREALESRKTVFGELDGKPVAAAIIRDYADYTEIALLGVLPSYTRQGFARKMVENAIVEAELSGHRCVQLEVLEGNTAAENLYISMGFELVDSYSQTYERTGRMVFKIYEYRIKVKYHRQSRWLD